MNTTLPTEILLKASPFKWVGILLVCVLFTWGGFWMLSDEENKLVAWTCLLLFGAMGVPVSLSQLIRPGTLILNEEGFEQFVFGRTLKCNWRNVSDFGVIRISRNKFVSFSRFEDEGKKMAYVSKAMTGGRSGMLRDTFGMKAQDLADLMNAFRNRALNL